jgi:hypothetical protein
MGILIQFRLSIERCPFRILLEKAHGLDILKRVSHHLEHRGQLLTFFVSVVKR